MTRSPPTANNHKQRNGNACVLFWANVTPTGGKKTKPVRALWGRGGGTETPRDGTHSHGPFPAPLNEMHVENTFTCCTHFWFYSAETPPRWI